MAGKHKVLAGALLQKGHGLTGVLLRSDKAASVTKVSVRMAKFCWESLASFSASLHLSAANLLSVKKAASLRSVSFHCLAEIHGHQNFHTRYEMSGHHQQ